jgi:small subunit ribosomal protein S17
MVIKERAGIVISDKQEKTITVAVQRRVSHKKFRKIMTVSKNFLASDPEGICNVGDRVVISETRPTSKNKRWVLKSILSKSSKSKLV